MVNQIGSRGRRTEDRVDPTRLVRVVKEIDGLRPTPAGNLIHHPASWMGSCWGMVHFLATNLVHHPDKLDGVFTWDLPTSFREHRWFTFLWPA